MNARTPMSEHDEPEASDPEASRRRDEIDHDDLIGFASPAALLGRRREVAPEPAPSRYVEPVVAAPLVPEPLLQEPILPEPPVAEPIIQPVFSATHRPAARPEPETRFAHDASPEPTPAWARETPLSEQPTETWGRRREQPVPNEAAMGLYTVYALILFAVPTLGVSAVIALLAVLTRSVPQDAMSASHFRFQKMTLLIGAGVALVGGVLIAIGLGVFVLFLLAVWLIVRGASGVLKLKAHKPIERPGTLFI